MSAGEAQSRPEPEPIPDDIVDWFVAFLRGGESDAARA